MKDAIAVCSFCLRASCWQLVDPCADMDVAEPKMLSVSVLRALSREDPKWKEWLDHGATDLLIIANLPGTNFGSGAADPRRRFVPLDKNAWRAKNRKLEIEIQDTLINVLNKPRN